MKTRLAPAGEDFTGESTVRKACEKWLTEPATQDLAVASVIRYTTSLHRIIARGFEKVTPSEAMVPRVDRFLKAVTAKHGPSAAKSAHTVLQHGLALAVRHGAIPSNPVRDAGKIIQPHNAPVAPTVKDVHAIQKIMRTYDTAPDKRGTRRTADLGDLFAILTATGCRTAEVLALRWEDVNLDHDPVLLTISGTVIIGTDGKVTRQDHPKTATSSRTLRIPQYAADVLTTRRVASYDWVFPSATGTLRWPHNLRRNWNEALKDTDYSGVNPRAIRKAVATLVRNELGLQTAKDQLGHASDVVTRQHYVQPSHQGPDATSVLERLGENSD